MARVEEEQPSVRVNGFDWPFHPLQVLSWFISAMDVVVYSFVGLPLVEGEHATILVAAFYWASVIALVLATATATGCNPVDPRVLQNQQSLEVEDEESDGLPFCPSCSVTVALRSKHCRACNKCVDVFDHHCIWLNNCVGRANYGAFFVAVCSVAVMTGILLSTCVYLLTDYYVNDVSFTQRAESVVFLRSAPEWLLLSSILALVVVNTPLFLLDVQLALLHLFLMSQQLTTYEYIVNKQDREANGDKARDLRPGNGRNLFKHIRTLPRCMDWIIFSRCGRRRRRRESCDARQTRPKDLSGPPASQGPVLSQGGVATAEGTPQPEPGAHKLCEADLSLHGLPTDQVCVGRPVSVLPEHADQVLAAKQDAGHCSVYAGIAMMWRFIVRLSQTSLVT